MDFIENLTTVFNNDPFPVYTAEQVKMMVIKAAEKTVKNAVDGGEFTDSLNRHQLGLLLLALQWNTTPGIRQAVRR